MKNSINTGFQKCALTYHWFSLFKNPEKIYFTCLTWIIKVSYMVPDTEKQGTYDIQSEHKNKQ